MTSWSFLTSHARVLLRIAHDPAARPRDIAASLDITERSTHGIVTDLTAAGYLIKQKDGRRNRYQIQAHLPLPEPATQEPATGEVLALLAGAAARLQLTGPGPTWVSARSGVSVVTEVSRGCAGQNTEVDVNLGTDAGGNLYATWDTQTSRGDVGWLSVSTDGGKTWDRPVRVTPGHNHAVHILASAGGPRGIACVGLADRRPPPPVMRPICAPTRSRRDDSARRSRFRPPTGTAQSGQATPWASLRSPAARSPSAGAARSAPTRTPRSGRQPSGWQAGVSRAGVALPGVARTATRNDQAGAHRAARGLRWPCHSVSRQLCSGNGSPRELVSLDAATSGSAAFVMTAFAVPIYLAQIARRDNGVSGWIAGLPAIVAGLADRWSLRVGEPFQPSEQCSSTAQVTGLAGAGLVLKVGFRFPGGKERTRQPGSGYGTGTRPSRLHAAHQSESAYALLIERCMPGTPLAQALPGPEQDQVVTGLLRQLWAQPHPAAPFRPLAHRYLAQEGQQP